MAVIRSAMPEGVVEDDVVGRGSKDGEGARFRSDGRGVVSSCLVAHMATRLKSKVKLSSEIGSADLVQPFECPDFTFFGKNATSTHSSDVTVAVSACDFRRIDRN